MSDEMCSESFQLMVTEDLSEALEKIPNLEIAQLKFSLTLPENNSNASLKEKLLEEITKNNMAPWYVQICQELSWDLDENLLQIMKSKNTEELEKLETLITETKDLFDDVDIREAYLKKAQFFCLIGDESNARTALEETLEITVPINHRMKILFHLIRLSLFFKNYKMILKYLEKAEALVDELEWDLKNRLKVYKGVCYMSIRRFEDAASLFLDSASTFTSHELLSFNDLIKYTVWCGMVVLPRNIVQDKIIRSADVQAIFYVNKLLDNYVTSLYNCQYSKFFRSLAEVELTMIENMFMNPHYKFYVHQMKIKAYSQLLHSYSSLSLPHMAEIFGVTPEYMENDLARYIAGGKLHCQIDKIEGRVVTKRTDEKSEQLSAIMKEGDSLLNRVQKLSRVTDV